MQWIVLFAVLAALVSAEQVPLEPVAMGPERLLLALSGVAAVALFARLAAVATVIGLRGDARGHEAVLKRFGLLRRVHAGLWIAVVLVILFGLNWAQLVRGNWALGKTFLADDLLILAPVLVPLVLSWAAFYDVDRCWQLVLADTSGRLPRPQSRGRYVALHVRHSLGLLLVPLLLVLAAFDCLDLIAPRVALEAAGTELLILPLALVALIFPWLLRHVWETEPLRDGKLRRQLTEVQRALGVRTREILLWRSDGTIVNAAVAGIVPAWRYVFLSDGLLARLSNDQIAAVFAHELGHVRHRHLGLRLLALVSPAVVWHAGTLSFPQLAAAVGRGAAGLGLDGMVTGGVLAMGGLVVYMFTLYAWYSRALELQADLCAASLARRDDKDPDGGADRDLQGADSLPPALPSLDQYVSSLQILHAAGGNASRHGGMFHPAIEQRISLLRQAAANPDLAVRFHRQMGALAWLLIGVTGVAVATVVAAYLLGMAGL